MTLFSYRRRIVLEVALEIARVWVFAGGITSGLVRDSVFVSVMERYDAVALRRAQ
jgi:hypothetical protein